MGVEIWKHRACCYTSWLRGHWWSCTRRFVAASLRGEHAVLPGLLSVGWFRLIRDLGTSLVAFLRGTCSWVLQKVGLCISVSRTHSPGLAAHLTEHFRCLYRPGLKNADKPRYRLLRRKLWSVRFFPLAVFPTIYQTLAAEALAMSMEAPMGNARDAAEERRIRRKGENAKVRAPRRGPSSWRRRKRRPWESTWGCSVTQEALANRSQGKPVQFPGALGLDIPFSPLYTAQIREEHAYYGFQGPLYLFDPCRLGLFLAYCAKGSNRSNFPWILLPRWPRWEIASYLYGACKHVSEFLKLPSGQCSASRVVDYLLRFHSLPPKRVPVFQVPSVVKNTGNVQRKFHDVVGRMRCGPARRWVQAQLAVLKGSKRWLRFFNGKRALRDVQSEDFRDWEVEQFADALALRSLRAAPGVWRLPVWEAGC